MVGRGAHDGQTGCEINAVATVESLERGKPLVMVHCQDTIKRIITATREEAIGSVRPERIDAV